eukprot:scaffold97426_cov30-Tisochrysis_lutea.AAC.2
MAAARLVLLTLAAGAWAKEGWNAPFGLEPGQTFVGHYTCGSTAWLFLTIEAASTERVDAAFHFLYPGSTQSGVFELHGTFIHGGRVLKMVSPRHARTLAPTHALSAIFCMDGPVVATAIAGARRLDSPTA